MEESKKSKSFWAATRDAWARSGDFRTKTGRADFFKEFLGLTLAGTLLCFLTIYVAIFCAFLIFGFGIIGMAFSFVVWGIFALVLFYVFLSQIALKARRWNDIGLSAWVLLPELILFAGLYLFVVINWNFPVFSPQHSLLVFVLWCLFALPGFLKGKNSGNIQESAVPKLFLGKWLGFEGRATRTEFWIGTVILTVAKLILFFFPAWLIDNLELITLVLLFLLHSPAWLFLFILEAALHARRCHDLEISAWMVGGEIFLLFVPVLGWALLPFPLIVLGFGAGTKGTNKYGKSKRYPLVENPPPTEFFAGTKFFFASVAGIVLMMLLLFLFLSFFWN